MSYNILKKNVKFSGPVSGTIEGIVDTSTNQSIAGHKTFSHTITSSAGVMLSGSGKVSASFYYGDGSNLTGVSAVPAGSDGNVQFTNGSVFGASSNLSFLTASNTLSITGDISASANVSGSAFYGDGANLTSVTASFVTASSISGLVEANQIKKAPGLSNDAGFLTIDRATNGGIVESTGLKVELGDLSGYSATFSQNQIMIISGSGIGNRSVTLEWLGDNLLTNATNIDAGTLNNARLDQNIARQTFSASVGISSSFFEGDGSGLTNVPCGPGGSDTEIQFNNAGTIDGSPDLTFANNSLISTTASFSKISSSLVPDANNTFYLGAQDLSSRWASVNSVAANFSGRAVMATGAVSQRLGVGTLNPTNELEVTGNTVVVGNISASAGITGSAFYGDGTTLTGVPFTTSPATSNIVFVADGAAQTLNSNGNLQWTGTKLATTNITASSNIEVGGHITGSGDLRLLNDGSIRLGGSSTISFDDGAGQLSSISQGGTNQLTIEAHNRLTIKADDYVIFHDSADNERLVVDYRTDDTTPIQIIRTDLPISSSDFVSASSYATAGGTVITDEGNFQGNNASFNEITASSVISSSAQISASSFHGDGSGLQNLPPPQFTYLHYINATTNLGTYQI